MIETVRPVPRKHLLAAIMLVALFLASTGTAVGIRTLLAADRIVPGVSIEGTDVGGLNAAEAQAVLGSQAKRIDEKQLELGLVDKMVKVQAQDIGIEADLEETINVALAVGHSGSLWEQLQERYRIKQEGYNLKLELRMDQEQLAGFLAQLAEQVNEPAQDAYFVLGSGNEPVAVPEQIGRSLEIAGAKEQIVAAVKAGEGTLRLPVQQVIPRTVAELRRRGINDVIGIFSTRFNAAATDRSYNLKLGADALNGYLIEPGEVFSFNAVVGPREAEQGYREAPIIINDELVPGVGGGICQVSSTLYNAVLLSGLKPVERRNHSLPSAYIGLGRDATVSYGGIDFKFKNTRPEPVMICSRVSGNQLFMAILGTARGEQVYIQTTVEQEIPFPIVYEEDPNLPPGTDTIEEEGKPGYKVSVTRTIRRNGNIVLHEVLSRDTYQPQPEIHQVGPPAEEQAAEELLPAPMGLPSAPTELPL
ncbi:MAG TPA: hypothetical protein GX016_00125 [Firmicutes bacterium]|nr:hypothetical protein [Bacillota bacterium]